MLRAAVYSLCCSVLVIWWPGHPAHGCPIPPTEPWTQASANGAFELIFEPGERPSQESGSWRREATYRLERVGARREVVWEVRSPELHDMGFVANDGDYVVTARAWPGGDALTIRNSAGALIRSLANHDLVSIAEQLEGARWSLKELDASQEYLEIEVAFYNDSSEQQRAITRRIQLMDGFVLDSPNTPPGFQLPAVACSAPAALQVGASLHYLTLACIDAARDHRVIREYELRDEHFRLVWALEFEGEDRRSWRARGAEDEPGPCETVYRNGKVVSERCGPGVTPPP